MTGRASPDATRDVVTAAIMLGLAGASTGAGRSGGGGVSRAIGGSGLDPRHSPRFAYLGPKICVRDPRARVWPPRIFRLPLRAPASPRGREQEGRASNGLHRSGA